MNNETFKYLTKNLKGFADLLLEWLFAALHPVSECETLLSIESGADRLRETLKLWSVSFLISLVVFLPLYSYYGIGLSSLEFHLPLFLYFTLGMIACGFAFQLSLRIHGIRADFSDIMAIYTAYFMCYQPFLNLLSYFVSFRFFATLCSVKTQGLNLSQAVQFFTTQAQAFARGPDFIYVGSKLSSLLLLPINCVSSALMATTVAARCSVPRQRSFSAYAFAMMLLLPLISAVQWMLVTFTEYTFISANNPVGLRH